MASTTPDRLFQIVNVRLPKPLQEQIERVAARDANSVSAVIRRLLSRAITEETR